MENQKIINLLDSSDNESQKFATKIWYIINDQNTGNNAYGNGEDGTTIKFETKVIKPNLCDYSDAYILVIGNIQNKLANSVVAFKNCAPFRTCDVTINDEHVEKKAEDLDIVMPMYNLLEYSDNYQDSTGSLYQFKRDEPPDDNADVANNTSSLVYKSKLISGTDNNNINNVKLVVPLKYISNFFRSLEMPLVNCKIDLELTWQKDCMISSVNAAAGQVVSFMIANTKLYIPAVTLSTKDNELTKQVNDGFRRSIYWNQYEFKPLTQQAANKTGITRFPLDAAFQGVNRLFVLAFEDTRAGEAADAPAPRNLVANRAIRDSYRKYFVPRVDITSYNVLIDGRNFYDQPINDSIRKYDEIKKIETGKGDNYMTGCLLDYDYFKNNYQLIAIDLSKTKRP